MLNQRLEKFMQQRKYWYVCSRVVALLFFATIFFVQVSWAGVHINTSRIVFDTNKKQSSITLRNSNAYPVMVQLWIDDGHPDNRPDMVFDTPLIALPPLLKLDPGEIRSVLLVNVAGKLTSEVEKLFWFNIYEIPPKPDEDLYSNVSPLMLLTMRTQYKVFLRNSKLMEVVDSAASRQEFRLVGNTLEIYNNSPFYMTFQEVRIEVDGSDKLLYPGMISPFTREAVELSSKLDSTLQHKVSFDYIDDNGNSLRFEGLSVN